jgi:hypothetical protein
MPVSDGLVIGGGLGMAVGASDGLTALANILDNWCSAESCLEPSLANGVAGAGCCKACIRSWAANMAASAEDVFGVWNV